MGSICKKILKLFKKVAERSKSYIFIRYAIVGYKLWDKEEREIKIARDIKFKKIWPDEIKKTVKKNNTINLFQKNEDEKKEENHFFVREDKEKDDVFKDTEKTKVEEEKIITESQEQGWRE